MALRSLPQWIVSQGEHHHLDELRLLEGEIAKVRRLYLELVLL